MIWRAEPDRGETAREWTPITPMGSGTKVRPSRRTGPIFVARDAGITGETEPDWPTIVGETVLDAPR